MAAPKGTAKSPVKKAAAKKGPTRSRKEAQTESAMVNLTDEIAKLSEVMEEMAVSAGIQEDGSIVPVQVGKKGKAAEDAGEMIHIFTLDDEPYSIPKDPNSMLLIRFLRESQQKKVGLTAATGNLLYALLGQDAMDALAESRDVSKEDVAKIMDIVTVIAFDALARLMKAGQAGAGPLGNS